MYKVKVLIKRRQSILDPQGKAAEQGAKLLGYNNIKEVRIDKQVEFVIDVLDEQAAEIEAKEFCSKLLSNPIMEDFEFSLVKINGN
ncbi:MAG: phosphoribosylformylglycinamidine synthase [Chlorobiaceae bacterium]|nr:phosphoribosylformylglycinamidine synthase [Chlorobiaceae bacterium]MBA4310437.1 phosphoribosylformylglycinamidine synthase [Chlorobiaceae bacterium]